MDQTLTVSEAFEAMRVFLTQFKTREPEESRLALDLLISWTEIQSDGQTADLAQWRDWIAAVSTVRSQLQAPEAPLRVTYDDQANAAYVYLTGDVLMPGRDTEPVEAPEGMQAMVMLDWKDGRIVGLEVLDASSLLHPDLLTAADS